MVQSKIKKKKKITPKKIEKSDRVINSIIVAVIIFAILALGYSVKTIFFSGTSDDQVVMQAPMGRMMLTNYDKELAKKFMDKDNDGKCDSCGMPVEMCIDSGELQCTMGSKSAIGKLDSAHMHADFKIYVNGNVIDFSDKAHMERMKTDLPVSSFIHVDSGSSSHEKTGDVLHMHATGVPLWIFFESVGMKFEKDCFTVDTGERYCNNGEKSLKFYVNGKENNEFRGYVFNDNDKILISYGNQDEDVSSQLNSITDYAKNH